MTVLRQYAALLNQPSLGASGGPGYDEVFGPDGLLRPAWKPLAESVGNLTDVDLDRLYKEVGRLLGDDGVTYRRPGGSSSSWRLDPMPLVFDAEAWAPLAAGLAQRAELLNAIVQDLYGPQRLLSERILPASVVFGHGGFVRPMVRPGGDTARPLVLTATDLGRDADGEWRVIADRAQAPSGIGYAMENRKVIAKVLPEMYRDAQIHRMEPYFWALRSALIQAAEGDHPDPRVVVLSPGPGSETAYDQAFLAIALGFPLVQGNDLVVRDGAVYLRPQHPAAQTYHDRVDVILRRVDASWSDPLELRADSQLGVAGLADASRRGAVRIVNGLGAGVLENPGLMPFMSTMCQRLLDEPLRLEPVDTWWLGDQASREEALSDLDAVLIRPIDGPTEELAELDAAGVRARVSLAPYRYVAQRRLPLSTAPSWQPSGSPRRAEAGTAAARSITLRAFTVRYGAAYRPLIGGLASVFDGGRSVAAKDVWVVKRNGSDPDQGLSDVLPVTASPAVAITVPRVAEDMFWVGRYAERAEDMLRLVLAAHGLAEEFRSRPRSGGGATLNVMMGAISRLAGHSDDELDDEFRSLLLDRTRDGSAASAMAGLRDALSGVRDQLSLDVWRAFSATDRAALALHESRIGTQIDESAGRMLTGVLALQGVTASMVRDPGWHMIGIGRHLERAIQLTHLLLATTTVRRGLDVDREVLAATLLAAESSVTHRRRYRGSIRTVGVLELLLTDHDNPRALVSALDEVARHLGQLPEATGASRPERLVADLHELVVEVDLPTLTAIGGVGRPNLEAFLLDVSARLHAIGDAISQAHFVTGPPPRQIASLSMVESLEKLEGA